MKRILSAEERVKLEEEFLREAHKSFNAMFFEGTFDKLVTFTQREERACEAVDKLWQWMMEKHIGMDERLDRSQLKGLCPKCGKMGRPRKGKEGQGLEDREVVGRRGEVEFDRAGYECPSCRIVFFPSGPAPGVGHRGIQSEGA